LAKHAPIAVKPDTGRLGPVAVEGFDGLLNVGPKLVPGVAWVKMLSVRHSAEYPPFASCVTSKTISFTTLNLSDCIVLSKWQPAAFAAFWAAAALAEEFEVMNAVTGTKLGTKWASGLFVPPSCHDYLTGGHKSRSCPKRAALWGSSPLTPSDAS
jgi:hypothetical protein